MIVYHGTTATRAARICKEGFRPRRPSRRVWFAKSRGYALQRAKTQARRSHDRPTVLTCDLDLFKLRSRFGPKRILYRENVLAIDAPLPISVLRSQPFSGAPSEPDEIAKWVCDILGLKPHKGPTRSHEGVKRLSRWVNRRMTANAKVKPSELIRMARQWLPEFFDSFEVDSDSLKAYRQSGAIDAVVNVGDIEPDSKEDDLIAELAAPSANRRILALTRLADRGVADLFDWCMLVLEDESHEVRLAALEMMLRCQDATPEAVFPLTEDPDVRIRGAAIAVQAKHGGGDRPRWFERGLKDPAPCVRLAAVKLLGDIDVRDHASMFELALHDSNPDVARFARKIVKAKSRASKD
jgi:hypothetical protein